MNIIKWKLNFVSCNFGLKSNLWLYQTAQALTGDYDSSKFVRPCLNNREFEQDNEVRRRRHTWQFLPYVHYLAHTELDVTGACTTYLPMCRCLWILTINLALIQKKQRDMKLYPVFVLLPSCRTSFTTKFAKVFVVNEGRRRRRDMDSCLAVLSWSG
jgi:hypothetical protein